MVSGGLFHGFQLWVNLPARLKMTPPRYQDIRAGQVALLSSADGGALLRVIAGSFGGHDGPGITHTPISLVHATVSPGASVRVPWPAHFNALGYVLARKRFVGKSIVETIVALPLVLPPTAIGYLLLSLLSMHGPLGPRTLGFDLACVRLG